MIKKIVAVLFVGAFIFATLPSETEAGIKRGKWVDVYNGNSIPVGAICANSLLTKKCVVGDTKTYGPSFGE